tara:strand:- start:356 stop:529 length:174 start_codon:yes stop_codon:yes gene_type:complete
MRIETKKGRLLEIKKIENKLEWYKNNVKKEVWNDKDHIIHTIINEHKYNLLILKSTL